MAQQLTKGKQQFLDSAGNPLAGGTVATYIPGTTTPKNTYQDSGYTIANTNPVTLDSAGECVMWGDGLYRLIVKDSSGNTVYDQDASGDVTTDTTTALADDLPWIDVTLYWGDAPQYATATTFTVSGNVTSRYEVDRRIRATVSAGSIYGTITASSYTTFTTVTVSWDSTQLDNTVSAIALGAVTAELKLLSQSNADAKYEPNGSDGSNFDGTTSANRTLTVAESGKHFAISGAVAAVTFTLPASPVGGNNYAIDSNASYQVSIDPNGGTFLFPNGSTSTSSHNLPLAAGSTAYVFFDGTNWRLIDELVGLWQWSSSRGTNGYAIKPDGTIEQWGYYYSASIPSGPTAGAAIGFPMVFPNACENIQITNDNNALGSLFFGADSPITSLTTLYFSAVNTSASAVSGGFFWRATGH